MGTSYLILLERYKYCNMENYNNDDKWLRQLMWAIGFVFLL